MNLGRLKAEITKEEGVRKTVYMDSLGVPTAGVGRNMRDVGLYDDEIDLMLTNDITRAVTNMVRNFPWSANMNDVRQEVLCQMIFQMGISGVSAFKNTLAAMKSGDYEAAAKGMGNSLWAKQTPNRARRLAERMRTGQI